MEEWRKEEVGVWGVFGVKLVVSVIFRCNDEKDCSIEFPFLKVLFWSFDETD